MNSEEAKNLVENTFSRSFDEGQFHRFSKQLLKHLDDSQERRSVWNNTYVKAAFRERIDYYKRLGSYETEGNLIDVLVVYLKRETTLERGRSTMRNFAADFLTQRQKDAVLVAFVSPTDSDWRFSFVKLETYLEDNRRELTPAKRSSFLVGENEKSHTAQTQFLPILQQTTDPTLADIETAFNIEKVTKEFFGKYKELYEKVRDAIAECCAKDAKVRGEFLANGMFTFAKDEKGIEKLDADGNRIKIPNSDDFAKKLLGQIVFLYFLQRKGWFGVERDKAWGTGDKNFLRSLFENQGNYKSHKLNRDLNFYEDILEPLFYNTLAIKRDGDWSDRFYCKIPFLNGGLFEPIYGYDWSNNELLLPETLFSNKENESDEGTGILDVFDLYNFTINEAEPLEVEVAVDPEMLGKIFENLLPENIRHGSGTYYTPRVIVAYMCQQSLINYLKTHLCGNTHEVSVSSGDKNALTNVRASAKINREDIESFIRFGSQQKDFTEADTQAHQDKFLPETIRQNSKKIDELLRKITVCDPAIGSGAFPVGMMQEIVKARMALYSSGKSPKPENETAEEKTSRLQTEAKAEQKKHYEIKRQTIENSLYGVDIDAGAVEIAKLRLWLSLIVDEADFQNIEPLPNLDYKIMQGNSLLDEFHGVKLIDEKLFEKNVFDKEAGIEEIRAEIAQYEKDLAKANVGRQSAIYELTRKRIEELNKQKKQLVEGDGSSQFGLFAQEDESQKKLEHLKAKIKEFFGKTNQHEKKNLREEIDRLEWEFIEAKLKADGKTDELAALAEANKERRKNYFLWQLNFPEIFQTGGFDVVIGNPPYYSISTLDDKAKEELVNSDYETFSKGSDIYCLFYERGFEILKKESEICLITSNRFCFTNYGVSLRKFLSARNILQLINFNEINVFETANVGSLICLVENEKPENSPVKALDFKLSDFIYSLDETIELKSKKIGKDFFGERQWSFEKDKLQEIKRKIEINGTQFSEWKNISINRGITTGLNQVFIISENKRDELIAADPKCYEILLPVLKGANIKRFSILPTKQYLIYGYTGINIEEYPSVLNYLKLHKSHLEEVYEAKNGQKKWYELRRCSYYDKFFKKKLIWTRLSPINAFAISENKEFSVDSTSFAVTEDAEYLCGVLNSKVVLFYFKLGSVIWGKDGIKWFGKYFDNIPIPEATESEKAEIENKVEQILDAKRENPQADTSKLEGEIDCLVYRLYDLSEDEIRIVEGREK